MSTKAGLCRTLKTNQFPFNRIIDQLLRIRKRVDKWMYCQANFYFEGWSQRSEDRPGSIRRKREISAVAL